MCFCLVPVEDGATLTLVYPAVHKTGDGMESMVLPGTGPELKPRKLVTLSVNARDQNSFVPSSGAKAKLTLDNGMYNQQVIMYCIGWHTWFQFICKFCYTLKTSSLYTSLEYPWWQTTIQPSGYSAAVKWARATNQELTMHLTAQDGLTV